MKWKAQVEVQDHNTGNWSTVHVKFDGSERYWEASEEALETACTKIDAHPSDDAIVLKMEEQ